MPKRDDIKKVLVIGSGPIVIGQAAEFDYAGTQACKSLKEEGIEVVLVNSNPATIMTDLETADIVYIEPLTSDFLAKIIEKEKPDGILPGLGGQTGLNLAVELAEKGILKKYNVELLGTPLQSIKQAEDREYFKKLMLELNEPIPESKIVTSLKEAIEFAKEIGFPLIVRPAYTLGGTGGGIAYNEDELMEIVSRGLNISMIHQVLLEKCVIGWKEIEYEVMRDKNDNCITICNMENIDPMGIHTGDSIVIAPSQTLSNKEYQMLRTASLKIIRALKIEGGCNIQFALAPDSFQYYVIEVNPRVSRSSALASKATGYPIARITAKIGIGLTLDEIKNQVTGETFAFFEPALDYVVVKIPRWPFDKFSSASRRIGTQMKATGEVMAIDRTFEAALMKGISSLEIGTSGPKLKDSEFWTTMELENKLENPTDERIFAVFEALRRKMSVSEINSLTNIDKWFLNKMKNIIDVEEEIKKYNIENLPPELFKKAKEMRFSDRYIAEILNCKEEEIRNLRKKLNLIPVYKMVDTCAAEFEAKTPYYYSTYEKEDEVKIEKDKKAIVIGGGPIRIGQGIEFDYCCVHCIFALRENGYKAIIVNNNPETVSTDFDISDKLYFEPITLEEVLNILLKENPDGVILQFGGQTPLNLSAGIAKEGINILGTSQEGIDIAENRDRFEKLLKELNIKRPPGKGVTSLEEAIKIAEEIGYPVLVRPSYVLGGRAMEIVYNREELLTYMHLAIEVNPEHPVLVDKYLKGKEVEVDALGSGDEVFIPGIMEHIERAGVHSGDSISVVPPQNLSKKIIREIANCTKKIGKALNIKGLFNIQYVVHEENLYVLEVNPRASRTVPYLSKVIGLPLVKIATKVMLGETLKELGFKEGIYPAPSVVGIKVPIFSYLKLTELDIGLGPEMKSTGEIMGIDYNFSHALLKAFISANLFVSDNKNLLVTIADFDKEDSLPIIYEFYKRGYKIYATEGTANFLEKNGIKVTKVKKLHQGSPNSLDLIMGGKIGLLINTISSDKVAEKDGAKIRRAAVEFNIPCITSLDTANALIYSISATQNKKYLEYLRVHPLNEFLRK